MAKIDPGIPGFELSQSADEVQKILNNVAGLTEDDVSELITLLDDIKGINSNDDGQNILEQLFNTIIKKDDVQDKLNESTSPPQTKVVTAAISEVETTLDNATVNVESLQQTVESLQQTVESLQQTVESLQQATEKVTSKYVMTFDEVSLYDIPEQALQYYGEKVEPFAIDSLFVLDNSDGEKSHSMLYYNDEIGYVLSETIPARYTAICKKTKEVVRAVDSENGAIEVLLLFY